MLAKFQAAWAKPAGTKKAMSEEALNWEEVDRLRKATRGCLAIMKDKINAQYEKRQEFDLSFGLGKEETPDKVDVVDRAREYREEMREKASALVKKREDMLVQLRKQDNESITVRKSKTPLRLSNNKMSLDM